MTTNRIEAFSDGVIAIIITIMVFDLKLPENIGNFDSNMFWKGLSQILPKLVSYVVSFTVLSIMWVNHHHIFQQIKHSNSILLWLNINLLFWMSLIPFSTNFMGLNLFLPEANMFYGFIFFMNSLSFMLLRNYAAGKGKLMHNTISEKQKQKAKIKNWIGVLLYAMAIFAAYLSVYLSFTLFLIVPIMYFIPEKMINEEI